MNKIITWDMGMSVFFAGAMTLAFTLVADPQMSRNLYSEERVIRPQTREIQVPLALPAIQDYIVQVKYRVETAGGEQVRCNGQLLDIKMGNISRHKIALRTYHIPRHLVKAAGNVILIRFESKYPQEFDLRVKNYLFAFAHDNVVVGLKNPVAGTSRDLGWSGYVVLNFLLTFGLWWVLCYGCMVMFSLPRTVALVNATLAFVPLSVVALLLGVGSTAGPYVVVLQPGYFMITTVLLITFVHLILSVLWAAIEYQPAGRFLMKNSVKTIAVPWRRTLGWIRQSTADATPYILWGTRIAHHAMAGFLCVFLLSGLAGINGLNPWAERLAYAAFYLLAIAIIMNAAVHFCRNHFVCHSEDNAREQAP